MTADIMSINSFCSSRPYQSYWLTICCILLLFGLSALHLYSLDPGIHLNQYLVDEWNQDRGLPSDTVRTIAQTADGYLWFGTNSGLARYDGIRFKIFEFASTQPQGNVIYSLYTDRLGNLWTATSVGLMKRQGNGFKGFTNRDGLSGNLISTIAEDIYGNLWIATSRFLNRMRGDSFTYTNLSKSLGISHIVEIHQDPQGGLWIVSGKSGLFYGQNQQFARISMNGLPQHSTHTLFQDKEKTLWIGSNLGLIRVRQPNNPQKKEISLFTPQHGLADNNVWSILEDRDGILWIGTERGLNRLIFDKQGRPKFETIMEDHIISALFEDREGSLWIGTIGSFLYRMRNPVVKTYYREAGVPGFVSALFRDSKDRLWFGTALGDIYRFDQEKFSPSFNQNNTINAGIRCIAEDSSGNLWLGTRTRGAIRLRDKDHLRYSVLNGLAGNHIKVIFRDSRDRLWLGTFGNGLSIYENGTFRTLDMKNGLSSNYITNIHEDRTKNIWIATLNGLILIPNGDVGKQGDFPKFLKGHWIYGIWEESREQILWLGTYKSGLIRFKEGKTFIFNEKKGFGSTSVYQIHQDRRNQFWISTRDGIIRVSKDELNQCAAGLIKRVHCINYGLSDGMIHIECSSAPRNSILVTGDERFWFATKKGIAVLDPAKIRLNLSLPHALIEEVFFNGKPILPNSQKKSYPGIKNIGFSFTAPTFIAPRKIKIQYKLQGYDHEWHTNAPDNERRVFYSNIDPGTYKFRVRATNRDGISSKTEAVFEFTIRHHFFETKWFWVMLLLMTGLLISLTYHGLKRYLQVRNLRNKYKSSTVDSRIIETTLEKLNRFLEEERVYREEDLSLNFLARKVDIAPRYLSQIINEQLNRNFWDLINGYRIKEAKSLLREHGENRHTILDIALEVGFNSKEVFNRTFKKHTGQTPTQYRKVSRT